MSINIMLIFIFLAVPVSSIQIPSIGNATFVPLSVSNPITIINRTCNQCLCMPFASNLILNCLPNNTCQFFSTFPLRYKIQSLTNARLYFLRGIFPNASQCCMPNTTYLLNKLQNATPTYINVTDPRSLVFDNHGYLVTVSQADSAIVRVNPTNMALISYTNYSFSSPRTITYFNESYFIGFDSFILVVDSNNLTIRHNITSSFLDGTRDMMFLNNGDRMVVASTDNQSLLFFNRSSTVSTNYTLDYTQSVSYPLPHGLFFINDTYFYATSWGSNTVYSYSAIQGNTTWTENLFIDARSMATEVSGAHITTDECGRFWFSLYSNGIKIYDSQGSYLGNFSLSNSFIFDTKITDDYVIYLSDENNNQLIRLDLDIQC